MAIIDWADIDRRSTELAGLDGVLTPAQKIELASLRKLALQLQGLDMAEYGGPTLYREGTLSSGDGHEGECWIDFDGPPFRWVTFGGKRYLAVWSYEP